VAERVVEDQVELQMQDLLEPSLLVVAVEVQDILDLLLVQILEVLVVLVL
jgi:hypothetical protein